MRIEFHATCTHNRSQPDQILRNSAVSLLTSFDGLATSPKAAPNVSVIALHLRTVAKVDNCCERYHRGREQGSTSRPPGLNENPSDCFHLIEKRLNRAVQSLITYTRSTVHTHIWMRKSQSPRLQTPIIIGGWFIWVKLSAKAPRQQGYPKTHQSRVLSKATLIS